MKIICAYSIEKDLKHKLLILSAVKKKMKRNPYAMTDIVEDALYEYFENHDDEIKKLMDEYHDQGGCFEL